jgi:hypothetical protein
MVNVLPITMAVEPPEEVITDAKKEAEHGDGDIHDYVLDRMEINWETNPPE